MKNKLIILLLCVLVLLPCGNGLCVRAENGTGTRQEVQAVMDGIVSYNMQVSCTDSMAEWIDSALSAEAGVGAEWYVMAISQSGEYDLGAYEQGLIDYLGSNSIYSATTRQKYALALCSVGSTDSYISRVLGDSVGQQGIMSWVYGLHLLNNGYTAEYGSEYVLEKLLSLQCEDGGWSLTGQKGDVDVSAMTIQALAVHYGDSDTVASAVDRGLDFLSCSQQEDGGYISYGVSNPESASQVLVALCALGIDACEDQRFIKNGNDLMDVMLTFRLEDGSFSHTHGGRSDTRATEQVYFGCAAYLRMLDGDSSIYVFDRRDPQGVRPDTVDTVYEDSSVPNGDTQAADRMGYKPWVCIAIAVVGCGVCAVLWLTGRKNIKYFIAVALCAAVCISVVCLTGNGQGTAGDRVVGSVTLTISCHTVAGRAEHIPDDGIILDTVTLDIEEGDTVYSVLVDAAKRYGIQIENNGNAKTAYIASINNIYEFDFGDLSGWEYRVNGERLSVGCGQYSVRDGDRIEWLYTCDLGNDIQ